MLKVFIELGRITIKQVSNAYEVKAQSIRRWIEHYGKEKLPGRILIQSVEELSRVKDLENETKRLKMVIGDQQVKIVYLEQCMNLAKSKLGKEFEKKIEF